MNDISRELAGLTGRVIDYRVMRSWRREMEMLGMSRLDDKWAKAGGVVQRAEQHIEGKLDALIAREDEVKAKTENVFAKQNAPLDAQIKALDALESKLDLLSNGGPDGPLPGSGTSSDSPPAVGQPPAIPFPGQ